MVTSPARILVVSHDPAIRNLISRFLTRQNYEIEATEDGKTAIAVFQQFNPDLVILDSDLPDASGYNLCQEMQSATGVFVLILTNRTDEAARTRAFSQGADDYITKPFSLGELGVRVGAILKRQRTVSTGEQQSLTFENLVIDPVRREVRLNGELIPLTALEFDLLYFLAKNPGRVWRRAELIQEVWDYEYVGDQRVVDVHLAQIRRRLESQQIDENNEILKQLRKQNEVLEQLRKQMNSLAVGRRIASAQQSHVLVVTDDRGRIEISLDQAIYSIGRDPNCDIRLVSQSVLRHHATLVQLLYKDGSFCYRIIDGAPRGKRSANGLLINGQKLQAHDLQHEDVIVFSPNVEAVYYRLKQDVGNPPDEFDIDDDDLAGGIAPVPRPWKPTPPPLTDGDAISPDRI